MNRDDVTIRQAEIIKAQVGPMLAYLGKLRTRMDKRGFLLDDPLYRDVSAAYNAVHALNVQLHYMTIKSGAGRGERKE